MMIWKWKDRIFRSGNGDEDDDLEMERSNLQICGGACSGGGGGGYGGGGGGYGGGGYGDNGGGSECSMDLN
ncbi:hypothetical protein FRX31_007008 [Thalictrum thalictroides]|uniref:Uncharacterized protein n=1 Tax=Thalictrum thalictroides TaxID=46969 RepID=A0A7J6X254_THATH|nr:hypothetical protein FRX31_007008 [Thalictrum thalictroides]